MDYAFFLPPLFGAAIGWLTNYVAIKLLFKPHRKVEIFGLNIQGVIPKRRKEISRSIARAIEKELLSSEDLAKVLSGLNWEEEIERTVEEAVEHRFSSKISSIPVIGLVSDNLKNQIKYYITKELLRQLERKKGSLAEKFKNNINIQELMISKIDQLDLKRFEALLTDFISRELKHLEWLGGLMGFFIGIAQSFFMYFYQ
ncbi:MAG: hypothetical protein A2W38_03960 [Deltaproteobacteria bacterium RBG_19FT_COMBO_58_16]|nr:MAG: hypothetical protein A2W38_03960 [Deltaproteobacteria bacterium RBG_19FT_COMBO_58_16]